MSSKRKRYGSGSRSGWGPPIRNSPCRRRAPGGCFRAEPGGQRRGRRRGRDKAGGSGLLVGRARPWPVLELPSGTREEPDSTRRPLWPVHLSSESLGLGDRLEGTDATRVAIRATPSHPRLADERIRLPPARFYLRPVRPELSDISLPLAGVRGRLPPARSSVPSVSRPLVAMRARLLPATPSVPTVSRTVPAIRVRVPPARPTVTPKSCPLPTLRARLPTMRRVLPPNSGPLPEKRPFARRVFVLAWGQNRAQRPRSTVRPAGPIIAQGVARRETSTCSGTRPDTVPRTEGGSYERNIAQAARTSRAGPRFHPGPPDGRGW